MAHFHVCHPGHQCDRGTNKENLREVGDRIVFAANQFTQSVVDTIAVRVLTSV